MGTSKARNSAGQDVERGGRDFSDGSRRLIRGIGGGVLTWCLACAVAIASLSASAGNILRSVSPDRALAFWPRNGFAEANLSLTTIATMRFPGHRVDWTVVRTEADRARRALTREPLAEEAFSALGLGADYAGDKAGARRLMAAAERLSRRDSVQNAWAIVDAGQRNDLHGLMRSLDRAVLTNPDTAPVYVPLLVKSLENEEAIPILAEMLGPRPSWELTFWRSATVDQAALRNAGILRSMLVRKAPGDRDVSDVLLRGLASARHFDVAQRLFASAYPGSFANDQLLRNGDFHEPMPAPVFDWDLVPSSGASASIDGERKTLQIGAIPGAGGTVAQQLVQLDRGRYLLAAQLAEPYARADTAATIKLRCAIGDTSLAELAIRGDRQQTAFEQNTDCRYFWVTIDAIPKDVDINGELAIKRISLVRL